jgi:uroporphyrinogen III methyltransferase / synthase
VVVTRATAQASTLTRRLTELGAEVVEVPTIEIVDAADGGQALATALADLADVDWLVVTSANGADRVIAAAPDLSARLDGAGTQVAVVGPGTAEAFGASGVHPHLQPRRFVAEGLLDVFPPPPDSGGRVLLPQAERARPVLADGLRRAGWEVIVVGAYRTTNPEVPPALATRARSADVVTFTSASTVEGYAAAVGIDPPPRAVACIGPITAEAARAAGLRVDAVAEPHTIGGLVDSVVELVAHGDPA